MSNRDCSLPLCSRTRWQQAVHMPGIYDLEVDTSVLSAEACADVIRQRLKEGPPSSAIFRLAAINTEEEYAPE